MKGQFSLMKENKDINIKEDIQMKNHESNNSDILGTKLFKFKKTTNTKKQFGENLRIEPINQLINFEPEQTASEVEQAIRKIPSQPYKVLDAPNLSDDFYLNLVDWS